MGAEGPYFGYTTSDNTPLVESRRLAVRMGEDIRYYPAPEGGRYANPTVDWDNPRGFDPGDETNKDTVAAYANDTVEKIYKRVMAQDAKAVREVAYQWVNVYSALEDVAGRVLDTANELKYGGDGRDTAGKGWTGAGADAFLARGPGATLKSIDEWKSAALVNANAAIELADEIDRHQSRMAEFYERYKSYMVARSNEFLPPGLSLEDVRRNPTSAMQYVDYMRIGANMKVAEARRIQADMAQAYRRVMYEDFAGGKATVYEGPTDAVVPNPDFISRALRSQLGVPNIAAPRVSPNIAAPTITPPTATQPDITAPDVTAPNVSRPDITAPNVDAPDLSPDVTAPDVTAPDITAPNVTAPASGLPVVPPVAPPVLPAGAPGPAGAPAVRPPALPAVPGVKGLLSNLPDAGPGVLRAAGAPPSAEGLPPSLPQPPRTGQQAPPPPQIKGRGPAQGAPAAPPGQGAPPVPPNQGQRGPGQSTPETPAAPGTPGQANEFGAPPAPPSSPVLRNPRSTPTPPPAGPGTGPGRGTPAGPGTGANSGTRRGTPAGPGSGPSSDPRRGTPAVPGVTTSGSAGPSATLHPDAAPPVLNPPRRGGTPAMPSAQASAPPGGPAAPGAAESPFVPPPPPTSSPVVGRQARGPSGGPPSEPSAGVVRGRRPGPGVAAGEAWIASRRKAKEEPAVSTVDEDFDKISKLLDEEAAWTVSTPGGGVLDRAPSQPVTPQTEPKPVLGT